MKCIILAAGIGTRMGEIGKDVPKCLLKIQKKPILEHQISIIKKSGIKKENVLLVIGKQGSCWREENVSIIRSLHNNIIINEKNVDLNQVYSFLIGMKNIKEDNILVMDGDLIASKEVIKHIISKKENSILLTQTPKSNDSSGNKIVLKGDKIVKVTREKVDKDFTIYAGMFLIAKKDFNSFIKESSKKKKS